MSIGTIILIILVIALLGGFSGIGGGPFYGTGYYGGGGPRPLIVIPPIFLLLRRLFFPPPPLHFTVQLLYRILDRRRGIVVAVPRFALHEQGRDGANGVTLWVEIAAHLRPGQRHRPRGAPAGPR